MKVVLIGTGNVSSVLGTLARNNGQEILRVIGRSAEKAARLAEKLDTAWDTRFSQADNTADICIAAVTDDALHEAHNWLQTGDTLLVHTAGSVPVDVLKTCSSRYGVLYPLQSLSAGVTGIPPIPFLVDGNSEKNSEDIRGFAGTLSDMVWQADDEQRRKMHLAAVMSSNFINHLMTLTDEFCRENGLDFKILMPLLEETLGRAVEHAPSEVQTGPAIRHDEKTINRHLLMLEKFPHMRTIYETMTSSIRKYHR
jgi:predicted short-subunit dehydrogenase-like oxidoreductase (DUF2520 family)